MSALAGHTGSYYSYSAIDAYAGIAAAGFRHVELAAVPGGVDHVNVHADPAETKAVLDEYGLEAVSISGHSILTTPDGLAHGLAVVSWAERFGLPIVNTAVGGHAPDTEEDETLFLANIGTLADAAGAAGITLALETHGDLMASGEKSRALLERIDHPAIRVNYDTANVEYYAGVSAADDIGSIADMVGHVHLKDARGGQGDWDFPAIGEGHVDFEKVLSVLRDAGYDGPYSVEIEFTGTVPWPPLAEVNDAMRTSYEALSELGLS
jgi:sugar phosphate isomerase/epimerase